MQSDTSLSSLLSVAEGAARAGGEVLVEAWEQERQIEYKGEIDLVTDVDRRSEQAVVSLLLSRFPDHGILAEEGTTGAQGSPYRWIVDPLDGTTNYAHHYPHFAVSVALERDGELVVGVVYDPLRGELFAAAAGNGSTLNGKPMRPSSVDQLGQALLCTGFPYDRSLFGPSLRRWEHFVRTAQAVRRDGSAALDICYVAAGRFDGFWEEHLKPWDAAAGILIVNEAGGTATDFTGGGPDLAVGALVATNGRLHDRLLRELATLEAQPSLGSGRG